jgi:cell division protein FtsA
MAEASSGIRIRRAFVAVGGATLRGDISTGSAIVSKADSEVTMLDVQKALDDSENNINLNNKKVIQAFPVAYKLDGKEVAGRLQGSIGNKLEVKALFVTCSLQHFEDLIEVIAEAGVEPIDVVPSPIAASHIALTKKQKIVGTAVVQIGSETVSVAVFENEKLISLTSFSIGGADITNDIALGMKVTLEEAEEIKLGTNQSYPFKKKTDEIIEARVADILELVENHLKKIKRSELLPAGIVFTGGGANTKGIEDLSRNFLKLPSKVGTTTLENILKTKLKDPAWFTVLGLLTNSKHKEVYKEGSFSNFMEEVKHALKSSLKQLMP